MKLRCLIIDDEPVARKILSEYISELEFLELMGTADSANKALAILDDQPFDLIFLDIQMPGLSGIELLRIRDMPGVILTTAFSDYALDGYELDIVDYLLKPVSFERFVKAAQRARERFVLKSKSAVNSGQADHFFIKSDGVWQKVVYHDLYFAEARLNYVLLHCRTGKIMAYLTLKGLAEQLAAGRFLKVHKSYLVNLDRIKAIHGDYLDMEIAQVPISQEAKDQMLRTILRQHLIQRDPVSNRNPEH